MDFIEIKPGTSIRVEDIEAIVANEDGSCIVKTDWNNYDSTFSYSVLLSLIQNKVEPEKLEGLRILKTLGTYVG